jgi:hypothetical protein
MAFAKHPEMVIASMPTSTWTVGEDLEKNFARQHRMPDLRQDDVPEAVVKSIAEYVYRTNIELYSHHAQSDRVTFPIPITEERVLSAFRYTVSPYTGGSDHGVFPGPRHPGLLVQRLARPGTTDRDRPDKSDPTQLKRVASSGPPRRWP